LLIPYKEFNKYACDLYLFILHFLNKEMKSLEDQSPVELQYSFIYPTSFEQHKIRYEPRFRSVYNNYNIFDILVIVGGFISLNRETSTI
jgi:hypothetical protein